MVIFVSTGVHRCRSEVRRLGSGAAGSGTDRGLENLRRENQYVHVVPFIIEADQQALIYLLLHNY